MPSSAMKPTEAGTLRYWPEAHSANDAADHRERDVGEYQRRLPHRPEGREQQQEDESQRNRHDQGKAGGGTLLVLELAAPGDRVARGQLHFRCHGLLASSTNPTRSRPLTFACTTE